MIDDLRADDGGRRITAGTAAAGRRRRRGADAEYHGDDGSGLEIGKLGPQLLQVAARDVAGLVGHHTDDLVRCFGLHQGARIDEDALGVDHEGVEGAVIDYDDADIALAKAGDAQDRLRIVAQKLFDLGIADDRERCGRVLLRGMRRHHHLGEHLGGADRNRSRHRDSARRMQQPRASTMHLRCHEK